MERLRFNTMIAALMEYTNYLARSEKRQRASRQSVEASIEALLLDAGAHAPRTSPRSCGSDLGHEYSIHNQRWPEWDEELAKEEEITLVVQVNGKVRDRITVPASITEDEAKKLAGEEKVKAHLRASRSLT